MLNVEHDFSSSYSCLGDGWTETPGDQLLASLWLPRNSIDILRGTPPGKVEVP